MVTGVDGGDKKDRCVLFKLTSLLRSFSCSSSNMIYISRALSA